MSIKFLLTDFDGGIKLAEMLFRTNIIGFVGTGEYKLSGNKAYSVGWYIT